MHKYEKNLCYTEASNLQCILLLKVRRVNFNLRSSAIRQGCKLSMQDKPASIHLPSPPCGSRLTATGPCSQGVRHCLGQMTRPNFCSFHSKKRLTNCNQLYITNKAEHFSFKSRRPMQVVKLIKEDWPIVL